jgi:hypothetical protein
MVIEVIEYLIQDLCWKTIHFGRREKKGSNIKKCRKQKKRKEEK